MTSVDWAIVAIYLIWIVWGGIRLTKRTKELEGYFLGGRSLPWWAVGLSVMLTATTGMLVSRCRITFRPFASVNCR